jgi:hypothetical protein
MQFGCAPFSLGVSQSQYATFSLGVSQSVSVCPSSLSHCGLLEPSSWLPAVHLKSWRQLQLVPDRVK